MSNKVILVGGFHEIIELSELCEKNIIGIIDNKLKGRYLGYEVLGGDNIAPKLYDVFKDIPLIISPDSPTLRMQLANYFSQIGFRFDCLISPKAQISVSAKIGKGSVIQSGVNVSAAVTIGNFARLNSCSNVMHDSLIGDFVTIAPNAVILGKVKINNNAYIGANATILPGIYVGQKSIVGAGAVVTKNVDDEITVAGNPAIRLERD